MTATNPHTILDDVYGRTHTPVVTKPIGDNRWIVACTCGWANGGLPVGSINKATNAFADHRIVVVAEIAARIDPLIGALRHIAKDACDTPLCARAKTSPDGPVCGPCHARDALAEFGPGATS